LAELEARLLYGRGLADGLQSVKGGCYDHLIDGPFPGCLRQRGLVQNMGGRITRKAIGVDRIRSFAGLVGIDLASARDM
jgi:hypothetical protein